MGFLDIFRKTGVDTVAGGSVGAAEVISGQGVTPTFSPQLAVENYKSWVYVAMNKNATAIAGQTLRLFATRQQGEERPKIAKYIELSKHEQAKVRAEGRLQKKASVCTAEEIVEICDHPFLDLMANPNPFRSGFEFMEQTKLWLDGTGNDFWLVDTGTGLMKGIPVNLWTLPSTLVNIVPDPKKFIKGYLYGRPGKRDALAPHEVVHHRMPSLKNQYYGKGRIEGMWQAVHGYQAIERYEAQTAASPIPQVVIKYADGALTTKQRKELTSEWSRILNGQSHKKSNVAGIADNTFDIEKLSFSPKEMQQVVGRKIRREEIINGHGQSMALYTENPNRANIEGAIFIWGRYELDPSLTRIAQKMNQTLLPMYESGDRLFCAFDKVAEEDSELKLKTNTEYVKNGIMTRNEVREREKLPPSADPLADELTISNPASSLGDRSETDNIDNDKSFELQGGTPGLEDGANFHPSLKGVPICVTM